MKRKNINKRKDYNWYFIAAGLLILIFLLRDMNNSKVISTDNLTEIEVRLKSELNKVKRRKSNTAFSFYANEYQCQFIITNSGAIAGGWSEFDTIKKGDELWITISKNKLELLDEKSEAVAILALKSKQGRIFGLEKYIESRKLYNLRIDFFRIFISLMLIFNGLNIIGGRLNYYIIAALIALVMIMKELNLGLYS